jgi:hypothetical protein
MIPSSPGSIAHHSSASRSFLLARTERGLRGLQLDTSHAARAKTGIYEEGTGLRTTHTEVDHAAGTMNYT